MSKSKRVGITPPKQLKKKTSLSKTPKQPKRVVSDEIDYYKN